mgnify:CR=1 FL=1
MQATGGWQEAVWGIWHGRIIGSLLTAASHRCGGGCHGLHRSRGLCAVGCLFCFVLFVCLFCFGLLVLLWFACFALVFVFLLVWCVKSRSRLHHRPCGHLLRRPPTQLRPSRLHLPMPEACTPWLPRRRTTPAAATYTATVHTAAASTAAACMATAHTVTAHTATVVPVVRMELRAA